MMFTARASKLFATVTFLAGLTTADGAFASVAITAVPNNDIIWQDSAGDLIALHTDGVSTSSTYFPDILPRGWDLVGTGDLNFDQYGDIIERNRTTGDVHIWLCQKDTHIGSGHVEAVPLDWQVAGVVDFDGDKKADILWRSAATGGVSIWFMDGATIKSVGFLPSVSSDWSISTVGDYDSDGMGDIIWRSASTGDVAGWFINGTTVKNFGLVWPGVDRNWQIVTSVDIDKNGRSDLVWWNPVTNQSVVWFMNGLTPTSGSVFSTAGLEIISAGLLMGRSGQIVYRNKSTFDIVVQWFIGTAVSNRTTPVTHFGVGWFSQHTLSNRNF